MNGLCRVAENSLAGRAILVAFDARSEGGMNRPYDIVTFDCYGTLVDWESGIGQAFIAAAAEDGVRLGRAEVLAAHAKVEPGVRAENFRTSA